MPQLHSANLNLYHIFYAVRRRLSEVTAAYWVDLEVYSAINKGILDIAAKSKCLKKSVTITTIASTQEYDLKSNGFSDIIDISEDGVSFKVNGSTYLPLKFRTKSKLSMEFPGWRSASASVPQYYYYDKSTKTIGLYPKPNSTNAGAYLDIFGYHRPRVLHAGTAAAGAATTLTLAAGSATVQSPSTVDDYYNGLYMEIYDGTGEGEIAKITDYVGSTRVCTVDFTSTPSTDSIYGMIPEIPQEAHELLEVYALWKLLLKGGSRTVLATQYRDEYYTGLAAFMGNFTENEDEEIVSESYR